MSPKTKPDASDWICFGLFFTAAAASVYLDHPFLAAWFGAGFGSVARDILNAVAAAERAEMVVDMKACSCCASGTTAANDKHTHSLGCPACPLESEP